jgi:hypothetical protein
MGLRRWNANANTWESFGTAQVNPSSIGAASALHAVNHALGGLDPITPISMGAVGVTNGSVTTASTSSGVVRNVFTSTSTPSGGIDGDVWLKYV